MMLLLFGWQKHPFLDSNLAILDDLFMKNLKKTAVALFLLFPLFSQARITDGKDHLKLSKNKISVVLDKGFHFVMQSPAGLYMD
jgi:hypothetical protein